MAANSFLLTWYEVFDSIQSNFASTQMDHHSSHWSQRDDHCRTYQLRAQTACRCSPQYLSNVLFKPACYCNPREATDGHVNLEASVARKGLSLQPNLSKLVSCFVCWFLSVESPSSYTYSIFHGRRQWDHKRTALFNKEQVGESQVLAWMRSSKKKMLKFKYWRAFQCCWCLRCENEAARNGRIYRETTLLSGTASKKKHA